MMSGLLWFNPNLSNLRNSFSVRTDLTFGALKYAT